MAKQLRKTLRLMSAGEVDCFFGELSRLIDPKSDLNWRTPLDLLVAVVLSAQATDKSVNKVTADLWRSCRSPEDYLELGQDQLQESIRTIGLFRTKAKSIIGICRDLLARHAGRVPETREELEALPGVGRKSANVVLNVVFGQPTLAVDTHVFRVANRCGLVRANTPLKTEEKLLARVPERFLLHAHHYLILHGRYTCMARQPACGYCPVRQWCQYPDKDAQ